MPTMAAGPAAVTDRAPIGMMSVQSPPVMVMSDAFAKDAIIAWYRGEFAAANAIIDTLCGHLAEMSGGGSEYDDVFAAIHQRRLNWIPVLQMQKYHSVADVSVELKKVTEKKAESKEKSFDEIVDCAEKKILEQESEQKAVIGNAEEVMEEAAVVEEDDSPNSDITDAGKILCFTILFQLVY